MTLLAVKIDNKAFDQAIKQLDQLPLELRSKAITTAIRKSSAIYRDALANELENKLNSQLTDSETKQSAKVKASRPTGGHLYETVIVKGLSLGQSDIAVVGPSWPAGNLVNFYVSAYMHPSWGHDPQISSLPIAYDAAVKLASSLSGPIQQTFVNVLTTEGAKLLKKFQTP